MRAKNKKTIQAVILSGLLSAIILTVALFVLKLSPFGGKALSAMDADFQYLDFYLYFKDVLEGKNNIGYTFSKTLGGSNIAVLSYYLSSPFCLLLAFFEKSNLHVYFDLMVVLKLSLASMTCCYYLLKRFEKNICKDIHLIFAVILAVGYGLSQYSIAQCSNMMWLDGVYMLPLIMLAVYRVVNNSSLWRLTVVIAYSILANWYIAGINCLFSIAWLVLEIGLWIGEHKIEKCKFKNIVSTIVKYGIAMADGVLISAVLFLSTIFALQNSTRGSLQINRLFDTRMIGNIFSAIDHYVYGSASAYGEVALFCGTLTIVVVITLFLSKEVERYKKVILGIAACFGIFMFYWNPLCVLFTLLKNAESYWYRYSHLGIFILIFLAGTAVFTIKEKANSKLPLKSGILFSLLLLATVYPRMMDNYYNVILMVVVSVCIGGSLSILSIDFVSEKRKNVVRTFAVVGLFVICVGEIQYNTIQMMKLYQADDVESFKTYEENTEQQILEIKQYDQSEYRVSQTSTRNMSDNGITAFYNEGLAYNYRSISGYTSSPDDNQRQFLDRLGYRACGENLCVVNTSIISADALMGVKYVLSKYPINGLISVDSLGKYNDKNTYENPFCLPMAFKYQKKGSELNLENPFVFQNSLYKELSGEEADIFIPLQYEVIQEGDISSGSPLVYNITVPAGNYTIYGNLPWNEEINADISVNEKYSLKYACWLSPSVFYIPVDENADCAQIIIQSPISYNLNREKIQFYALDLDKLTSISGKIQENEVEKYTIQNGNISMEVNTNKENEAVYLAVPYDKGWRITKNGQIIKADLVGDCMYSIPLSAGENIIEMEYHVPGLKAGAVVSFIGVIGLFLLILFETRTKIRRN